MVVKAVGKAAQASSTLEGGGGKRKREGIGEEMGGRGEEIGGREGGEIEENGWREGRWEGREGERGWERRKGGGKERKKRKGGGREGERG